MKQQFGKCISWIRRARQARPLAMALAVSALAVVIVFAALGSATPVAAQGPTSCFEQMVDGAQAQTIEFVSATYTVTVPSGSDACVESDINLLLGFVSTNPFAVNGDGASAVPTPGTGFLYGQGPISGTLSYNVTAPSVTELVLTDFNGTGASVIVWLGKLKSATTTASAPTPVAKATDLVLLQAGDTLTKGWTNGNEPFWGPFTWVAGSLDLVIKASDAFTMVETIVGYSDVPAIKCGTDCWQATVPAEGLWETTDLEGLYWTDLLVGAPDARVMIPASVQSTKASSATGSPAGTTARTGGGAANGVAPQVWAAPAWKYVPLLIRPSR